MENQKKPGFVLSIEQLDALAQSFLPAMQRFFASERGKKIWEEHLKEIEQTKENAA